MQMVMEKIVLYQAIFQLDGVELEFSPESRSAIAQLSITKKTGARGIRNIIEGLLLDLQFNLPELAKDGLRKVIVTEKSVSNRIPGPDPYPWLVLVYKTIEEVA